MPFVVNYPHPETGVNKMTHNDHDCSQCTKPTCPSNILPPPEPVVNIDNDHVTSGTGNPRYPGKVFQNNVEEPLLPAPPLVDQMHDGGQSLRASDGKSYDWRGPAHPETNYPML